MKLKEWWGKQWVKNLVLFSILAVIFFTNAGQWVMVTFTQWNLDKPSYLTPVENPSALYGYDLRMVGAEGDTMRLSDYRGDVVFLNLWASWCVPCLAEFEGIAELKEQVPELKFVVMNLEEQAVFEQFLEQTSHDLPFKRIFTPVPGELATPSIPATFILDGEGRILHKYIGAADWSDPMVVNQLRKLVQ